LRAADFVGREKRTLSCRLRFVFSQHATVAMLQTASACKHDPYVRRTKHTLRRTKHTPSIIPTSSSRRKRGRLAAIAIGVNSIYIGITNILPRPAAYAQWRVQFQQQPLSHPKSVSWQVGKSRPTQKKYF